MLTEIQQGMIESRLKEQLGTLKIFFERFCPDKNFSEELSGILQRAISDDQSKHAYLEERDLRKRRLTSLELPLYIEQELNGILNPNFEMLKKLSILNHGRDVEVSEDAFNKIKEEMQAYALIQLKEILSKPKFKDDVDWEHIFPPEQIAEYNDPRNLDHPKAKI
jgi:hypothetical protein